MSCGELCCVTCVCDVCVCDVCVDVSVDVCETCGM